MKKILYGVDIGGTKLSTTLISSSGELIDKCIDCDHAESDDPMSIEVSKIGPDVGVIGAPSLALELC